MSSKRHAYFPSTPSPFNNQHVNSHVADYGTPYSNSSNDWLNIDPFALRIPIDSSHSVQSSRPSSATSAANFYSSQANLYAPSLPPTSLAPKSANTCENSSSRLSSATSAAHYYANKISLYAPSPPPVCADLATESTYQDNDCVFHEGFSDRGYKPDRNRERIKRDFETPNSIPKMPPEYQRGSRLTDANLKAHTRGTVNPCHSAHYAASVATTATITDVTIEEDMRKGRTIYQSPHYAPTAATSASIYSQESAPRSYYESDPSTLNNYPIPVIPLTTTAKPHGQTFTHPKDIDSPWQSARGSSHTISTVQASVPPTDYFRSQTSLTSQTSHNTSLPHPVKPKYSPDINKVLPPIPNVAQHCIIPQITKEPKSVRYAENDEICIPRPQSIEYLPVGPNAAFSIDASAIGLGIRNYPVKRGQHKHSASASTSDSNRHLKSSSASVKSLPMSSVAMGDPALLKKNRKNKSSVDLGETQSLHSAKHHAKMTATKRFLGSIGLDRFLPKKKNNLSSLDLDEYEASRYFSKTYETYGKSQ